MIRQIGTESTSIQVDCEGIPYADPRLDAFAEWLKALDRSDWRTGRAATRSLRQRGISVCLTSLRMEGGRR